MFAHNNSQHLILAFVGSHWLASRSRYNPFINLSNSYENFSVNSFRLFFKPKRLTKGEKNNLNKLVGAESIFHPG